MSKAASTMAVDPTQERRIDILTEHLRDAIDSSREAFRGWPNARVLATALDRFVESKSKVIVGVSVLRKR